MTTFLNRPYSTPTRRFFEGRTDQGIVRRRHILECLADGRPRSVAEIATLVDLSRDGAHQHVLRLVRGGHLVITTPAARVGTKAGNTPAFYGLAPKVSDDAAPLSPAPSSASDG
jgi:predicted ArsR family transcriptional regulator